SSDLQKLLHDPFNPDPRTFNNNRLVYPAKIYGKPIGTDSPPCWAGGGSTGSSSAGFLRAYRADVLRYLKYDPVYGTRVPLVKAQFPDSGKGNAVPITEG